MEIGRHLCYGRRRLETMNQLLLTFYGDDFTGSTDALEALSRGGVRTVLFLEPPAPELIEERFGDARAVGLAGVSRTMAPAEMDEALPGAFTALKRLGAPLCHYKVCSTFDSAAHVGSIGRAIEIGYDIFQPPFVPLIAGAPALKRYLLFGNLFAAAGGVVFRLDRHPTMSRHPVTPMDESDLRRHLARQTALKMGLVDVLALEGAQEDVQQALQEALAEGAQIVFFDTLTAAQGEKIGQTVWQRCQQTPLFVVGSSGVEYAMAAHWRTAGIVDGVTEYAAAEAVEKVLVMSGSASPVTAEQIRWAVEHGFAGLRLDARRLVDRQTTGAEIHRVCAEAGPALERGQSVVLYSALGPDDDGIMRGQGAGQADSSASRLLAEAQGRITRRLIETSDVRRVCVAGGDTCGYVVQQLELFALEMLAPLAPGGPLCLAHAHERRLDGLELALKGGQLGQVDYFGRLLGGDHAGRESTRV